MDVVTLKVFDGSDFGNLNENSPFLRFSRSAIVTVFDFLDTDSVTVTLLLIRGVEDIEFTKASLRTMLKISPFFKFVSEINVKF
mmetsp:Transcript_28359/g.39026  ORF Transcript_28359/g.39026 Transcript_28359/m.39026 type:complete len:84 (+) Transcript_28359:1991-2242(+)